MLNDLDESVFAPPHREDRPGDSVLKPPLPKTAAHHVVKNLREIAWLEAGYRCSFLERKPQSGYFILDDPAMKWYQTYVPGRELQRGSFCFEAILPPS